MAWYVVAQYLSSVLSALTITSCAFLKVPQIRRIKKTNSTEGLNLRAIIFEICRTSFPHIGTIHDYAHQADVRTTSMVDCINIFVNSYSVNMLYQYCNNFAVLTYLEYPIVLLQIHILLFYVLRHRNKHRNPLYFLALAVYFSLVIGFATKFLSTRILNTIQPISTPFSLMAKVQYIRGIRADRNADNISLVTWVISVLTNMARVYTIAMDTMDVSMLANYVLSSLLSSAVLFTAMFYQFTKPDPPTNPDPTDLPRRSRRKSSHND